MAEMLPPLLSISAFPMAATITADCLIIGSQMIAVHVII